MKKLFAVLLSALLLTGCFACGGKPEGEVVSVEMGTEPISLVYFPGQKLKSGGGSVKLTYADGETREINLEEEMCSFDFTAPGKKTVEVAVAGRQTSFEAYVVNRRVCKAESVQEAVDAAEDGDILWLAPGCYHEQLVIDGKSLTLLGDGGGALFMGPKKYEELVSESGVSAIILLKNGAEAALQRITVYPEAKKVRSSDSLSKLRFAGVAALGSRLKLTECRIRGFDEDEALFWDEESEVKTENLQCKR